MPTVLGAPVLRRLYNPLGNDEGRVCRHHARRRAHRPPRPDLYPRHHHREPAGGSVALARADRPRSWRPLQLRRVGERSRLSDPQRGRRDREAPGPRRGRPGPARTRRLPHLRSGRSRPEPARWSCGADRTTAPDRPATTTAPTRPGPGRSRRAGEAEPGSSRASASGTRRGIGDVAHRRADRLRDGASHATQHRGARRAHDHGWRSFPAPHTPAAQRRPPNPACDTAGHRRHGPRPAGLRTGCPSGASARPSPAEGIGAGPLPHRASAGSRARSQAKAHVDPELTARMAAG